MVVACFLAHALEGVAIAIRHRSLDRVELNVSRALGQFHDLRGSWLGLRNVGRWDVIFGTAARRMIYAWTRWSGKRFSGRLS
jgi:hypothetical protein